MITACNISKTCTGTHNFIYSFFVDFEVFDRVWLEDMGNYEMYNIYKSSKICMKRRLIFSGYCSQLDHKVQVSNPAGGKILYRDFHYHPWSWYFCCIWQGRVQYYSVEPASVAQLDAPSDWRPGGRGFNPRQGQQHSFVEIDKKYFLHSFFPFCWFKKGSCQFLAKECTNCDNTG